MADHRQGRLDGDREQGHGTGTAQVVDLALRHDPQSRAAIAARHGLAECRRLLRDGPSMAKVDRDGSDLGRQREASR